MKNKGVQGMLVALLCVSLSGCATMTLIKDKNAGWKKGDFSATLPVGWVKYTYHGMLLALTRDGNLLQNITITRAKTNKDLPKTKRRITEDMLLQEVADVLLDELALSEGITDFKVVAKKPAQVDGKEAIELEYTYRNNSFVPYHGLSYGFIHRKKFYEIQYTAMEQHYHAASVQAYRDFVQSFRIKER